MRCAERGGPALALGLHQRNPVDLVGMGTAPRRPPFAATGRTISPHRDYFERVPTLSAWGSSPGSAAPAATVAQPVPHPWNNSSHDVRQKKTKKMSPEACHFRECRARRWPRPIGGCEQDQVEHHRRCCLHQLRSAKVSPLPQKEFLCPHISRAIILPSGCSKRRRHAPFFFGVFFFWVGQHPSETPRVLPAHF